MAKARPVPASIGVAIIARDAAKTLGACLASFRPYVSQVVVCVDELTKDRTAQVAKRGGAEVYPIKVSDWHECPVHERQLAQHFANARQESFSHLDPDLDFWMWVDADDVVIGAELLPKLCEILPENAVGAWFPYDYSSIQLDSGDSQVNTVFHRERLLRTRIDGVQADWRWEGRVHETVKAANVSGIWTTDEHIRISHQPGQHTTPASALRNMLLLEIDYEEDPSSARTLFYLGNQHFAIGNWQGAAYWYEELTNRGQGTNPYELWQGYLYMSYCYERMGDMDSATKAAYAALDCVPQHGEPYFQLARLAVLHGENEKAIFWNDLGHAMARPPFFCFQNPLDYTYHSVLVSGEAYLNMGNVTRAKAEFEKAAAVLPDEKVQAALEDATQREQNVRAAESFVQLAPLLNGQLFDAYKQLPESVKAHGRTRELVMPTLLKNRLGLTPSMAIYCGGAWEPWYPGSIDTTGIGGSETAVIEIAKRFAADGWTVDVYNNADKYEGIYDGVGYWDARRAEWDADVMVSWRQPGMPLPTQASGKKVLWCHDLNYGPDAQAGFEQRWDVIAGVSEWHARMLRRYYGVEAVSLPNGINLGRFISTEEDPRPFVSRKVPFRCVYASSADRGLATLLSLWPDIVEIEPAAELHVAYGWETIDRMIASGQRPQLAEFKADIEKRIAETPNVVWRGRLNQRELAQLYGESVAWTYPTDFLEVSCISAMEAMAGGAVPVTTQAGALSETVSSAGLLVPGPTTSRPYRETYTRVLTGVLTEANTQMKYSALGRQRAQELTWDKAYQKWLEVLGFAKAEPEEVFAYA